MLYASKGDIQLHTLITKLSSHVAHTDYLGMIVGYSVLGGLIGFNTNIGSSPNRGRNPNNLNPQAIEQFKFEEIRSVYSKCNSTLESVIEHDANTAISILMSTYDSKINSLFEDNQLMKEKSVLLKNIFANIDSPKHYADLLRKKGIKLVALARDKGSFTRPYDFLNEDYKAVTATFAPKTLYSY